MWLKKYFILLLITQLSFSQSITLEDKIYNAVDAFVANPTTENLKNLNSTEHAFWKNPTPKTKNELLAIVILNCNKAYYENQFNKVQEAVASYEKAWKIYQKYHLNNYDIVEFCLKPLGNLYTILGDYDNAENTIKQYYYIANQDKNQDKKIAAILNLSNVYQNSGKIDLAIDLLEKTIKTEKLSNIQKGILWNNLGNNYLLSSKGNLMRPEIHQNSKNAFELAVQYLKNERGQSETLSNSYRNLATLNRQRENFKIANSYLSEAEKLFLETNHQPRKTAKLYYERALLLFDEQKFTESKKQITAIFKILLSKYNAKDILPNQSQLYAETVLIDALDLQAEILKQKHPKKALKAYELSFYIEDLLMNTLVYENSKILAQLRSRNRTEKCLTIYHQLYKEENKIQYLEDAFQLSERTKSGILKNYRSNIKNASIEEKQFSKQLQNLNNDILKEQQKGDLADISKINLLIKKQNEMMLSLKKVQLKNQDYIPEKCDLKSLFSKLEKEKAIMVHYFMGFENQYYFTLENNQINLNRLNTAHVSIPKIARFVDYFNSADVITNDISGYNKCGKEAFDILKLPNNSIYKTIVIVPDGILNFMPFEALITKESNTTNFAKMHYLINDYAIAYNNSASFYLNGKPFSKEEKKVLGIFPVFENTDYALRFSKDEMQSIQKNFEGRFLENTDATFDNFKTNAPNYTILHLSTHAAAGDIETPASIKFYDQEILYSELYHLNINPDLVVLSACETGIGKLFKAEGAMSIARGFQLAGAQNLLISLWKVNDFTTSVVMDYFYQNIKNDQSYFEANRQAKLDFLKDKTIPNAKKSPYYWGAFVYYGAAETSEKTNYGLYIWISIGIIGLLFLLKKGFYKVTQNRKRRFAKFDKH